MSSSATLVFLLLLCICLFSVWDSHDTHDIFFFCFIYSSVLLASTTTALLRRAIHSLHTCGTKCVQENRQNDWLGCCFGESRAVEGKKLFHSLNLPLPTTLLHQRWRVLVWQALEFRVCAVTKILITQTQLAGSFFRHTSCVSLTMQRSTYDSFKTISQNPFLQTALDGFISYHWNDPRRCIHRFPIKLFPPLVQLFQLHFLFAPSATPLHSLLFFEFSLTKKKIDWLVGFAGAETLVPNRAVENLYLTPQSACDSAYSFSTFFPAARDRAPLFRNQLSVAPINVWQDKNRSRRHHVGTPSSRLRKPNPGVQTEDESPQRIRKSKQAD